MEKYRGAYLTAMAARWSYLTPRPEQASRSDEVQTGRRQGRTIPGVAQLRSGYRGVEVLLACETVHVDDPGRQAVMGRLGM